MATIIQQSWNYDSLSVGEWQQETCLITIIEQVASNKSSLLLAIQKQNTQILQLFTMIIKIKYLQMLSKCQG